MGSPFPCPVGPPPGGQGWGRLGMFAEGGTGPEGRPQHVGQGCPPGWLSTGARSSEGTAYVLLTS